MPAAVATQSAKPEAVNARFYGHGNRLAGGFRLVTALALLALSACGTKGDLECPRGTVPQIDGTCRPPPPPPPPPPPK